jgi:hypothetical protein
MWLLVLLNTIGILQEPYEPWRGLRTILILRLDFLSVSHESVWLHTDTLFFLHVRSLFSGTRSTYSFRAIFIRDQESGSSLLLLSFD